jgi:hypothetical protein
MSFVEAMSRKELLALPAVVSLVTAARALGIGRTRAFELARRGAFPVPVLRVGLTYRVPTAPLLRLLGLSSDRTDLSGNQARS